MSLIQRMLPEFRSLVEQPLARAFSRPLFGPQSLIDPFFRDPFFQEIRQPAIDLRETDKEYLVEAELPGMSKDNLQLEVVNDNVLVISGQTEQQREIPEKSTEVEPRQGRETFWANERTTGAFRRSITFPHTLDPSKVSAQMKEGVLHVSIAKEPTKVNKIQIEA